MRQEFYASTLLGHKFARLINEIDRTVEVWDMLRIQKTISEGTYLHVFLLWQDLLENIKDEMDASIELFSLSNAGIHSKNMKSTLKDLKRMSSYTVRINTALGRQCFDIFTGLSNVHAAVITLFMVSDVQIKDVNSFISFVDIKYNEVSQALLELKKVVCNAKENAK